MKDMTKVTQRLASLNERQAVLRNMCVPCVTCV